MLVMMHLVMRTVMCMARRHVADVNVDDQCTGCLGKSREGTRILNNSLFAEPQDRFHGRLVREAPILLACRCHQPSLLVSRQASVAFVEVSRPPHAQHG